MSQRHLLSTAASLLVTALLLWHWSQRAFEIRLLDGDGQPVTLRPSRVAEAPLSDIQTDQPTAFRFRAPFTLLVFLSPADCSSCLSQTVVWNALAKADAGRLHVQGIVVRSTSDEARQYSRDFRPEFPLGLDATGAIGDVLQAVKTPIKVLVDARGRPVLAFAASTDDSDLAAEVRRRVFDTSSR